MVCSEVAIFYSLCYILCLLHVTERAIILRLFLNRTLFHSYIWNMIMLCGRLKFFGCVFFFKFLCVYSVIYLHFTQGKYYSLLEHDAYQAQRSIFQIKSENRIIVRIFFFVYVYFVGLILYFLFIHLLVGSLLALTLCWLYVGSMLILWLHYNFHLCIFFSLSFAFVYFVHAWITKRT